MAKKKSIKPRSKRRAPKHYNTRPTPAPNLSSDPARIAKR